MSLMPRLCHPVEKTLRHHINSRGQYPKYRPVQYTYMRVGTQGK